MTERDWRIFREDNDISIKSGRVPKPFRRWDDIPSMNIEIKRNLEYLGYTKPMPI